MMTAEEKAAYINAQAAAALIEAMGMHAENMQRQVLGQSMAYTEGEFSALVERFGLGHNAVVLWFRQ